LILASAALLLAAAGAHKLRALRQFKDILEAYRVLPSAAARRLAWLVPCLELTAAMALLGEGTRRAAVLAAIGIWLAYAAAIALNLARGRRDLDCGCGAARDRRPIAPWMVWRNLLLAAGLGLCALPWSARRLDPSDFLTLAGGLAVCVMLYSAVDRLLGDVAPRAQAMRRAA
jgi:uncharacterized membrane protein YphA (DoxX/SURF4 family)